MTEHDPAVLFPCPFSKGYGIPARQAWPLLQVFLSYRLVLAGVFVLWLYGLPEAPIWIVSSKPLFFFSSQAYLGMAVLAFLLLPLRPGGYAAIAQFAVFSDIVFLTLLMHACGGVKSGIGMLLAVSIAAAGLLIGGRCAMLFAALASLTVLAEQAYAAQTHGLELGTYPHAGILGAAFFTIASLAHVFAKQNEQARRLHQQQQQTISQLGDLNQYIIQHLQSGLIITDLNQNIQLTNDAAIRLTQAQNPHPGRLADLCPQLAEAFQVWRADNGKDSAPLDSANLGRMHCRFMTLPDQQQAFCLIMIEDERLYKQRLQQGKLASLGRLAASIAHEIRNPLSAISHAGQLLSESPQLAGDDLKLTQIIRSQCARVNRTIEDILLLSRRNNARRQLVELQPWLRRYLVDFLAERQMPASLFRLATAEEPLHALVDSHHLRQILDNLCQNALRYGHPELGPILIRCLAVNHCPTIEVVDNGHGIDEDTSRHLFEPFFTTSPTGTGLGLYICKELAELNQAKLHYYLTDDQRSCFQLRLLHGHSHLIEL